MSRIMFMRSLSCALTSRSALASGHIWHDYSLIARRYSMLIKYPAHLLYPSLVSTQWVGLNMLQKRERSGKGKNRFLRRSDMRLSRKVKKGEKRKNQEKARKQLELKQRPLIDLDTRKQEVIASLIHQVKTERNSNRQHLHDSVVNDIHQIVRNSRSLQKRQRLDDLYKEQLNETRTTPHYQQLLDVRKKLPIFSMQNKILKSIRDNQAIVISGHTGCGKTTQLPQFILDEAIDNNNGSLCKILCTQPRRISAISVAERIQDERGEKKQPGSSVGYQIRLETKLPRRYGSIILCTTGILLRKLQSDPLLSQYSHLIIDEIHERDAMSDFLLICLQDILVKRPDLKVILMSATLNAKKFSQYFNNCPIIEIPGTLYPVKHYYLEDIITFLNNRKNYYQPKVRNPQDSGEDKMNNEIISSETDAWYKYLETTSNKYSPTVAKSIKQMAFKKLDFTLIQDLLIHINSNMEEGAILCFVPGWDDIRKLYETLIGNPRFSSDQYVILPLHSQLSTANQRKIFDKPQQSVRKIIIATDIAETSITVNDVCFVIDCGKVKEKLYDAVGGFETLAPVWTSKSSARQRAGRAGRVQPGHCFYLYPKFIAQHMQEYNLPEILRTPLDELCLQIKKLNLGMISPFLSKALDPPDDGAVARAIHLLKDLNAMNSDESLTPLGYYLATLPVDPRIGKIILFGAMFSCLYPAVVISAFLATKDPFIFPMDRKAEVYKIRKKFSGNSFSDHLTSVVAFYTWEKAMQRKTAAEFCRDNYLSQSGLRTILGLAQQFCNLLYEIGFVDTKNIRSQNYNYNSSNEKLLKAIICAGLYPSVLQIKYRNNKRRSPRFYTRSGEQVNLHQSSVLSNYRRFDSDWLVYHKKMKLGEQVHVFDTTMVSPLSLLFFGGDIDVKQSESNISIDSWINFEANPSLARIIMQLRRQLDNYLEQKINQPSLKLTASEDSSDLKGRLLHEIISLITEENVSEQIKRRKIYEPN